MWECNYGKEPFDLKLMVLRLIKNIWIPLLGTIAGLMLVVGAYYLLTIHGKPRQYEITTTYYVDYATAPWLDATYYINDFTWNTWVKSDELIGSIREKAAMAETATKEQMQGYLSASLESDLNVPVFTVRTEDVSLTLLLNEALKETLFEFADRQKEIQEIRVVDTEGPHPVIIDNRTVQALILGSVLGLFFTLVIMGIRYLCDDSIRIPNTFTYRYGIPMLGVIECPSSMEAKDSMEDDSIEKDGCLSAEVREHLKYVFREKGQIAVTATDPDADIQAAVQVLGAERYESVPWVVGDPGAVTALRKAEGILLLVKAGAYNGKRIEKVLEFLRIQGCTVDGALLWNGDRKLIQAYFLPGTFGRKWKKNIPRK